MRLGIQDHRVLYAFVDKRQATGHKLSTDGQRVDGHWLGGSRIAEWIGGQIVFNDLGSRAAQSVHRQIRGHAAKWMISDWQGLGDIVRKRRRAKRSYR